MKVCVVGAGAIGGLIGVRLARAGQARVSALARGATLQALQRAGWRLDDDEGQHGVQVTCSDDPGALGPQDLVVIAVKAQALGELAGRLGPLLAPHTVVLPAMNGVPWWFAEGLQSVDPGGAIAAAIPRHHVLGCVVHASASAEGPGRVRHHSGLGLVIGEPDGGRSARAEEVAALLGAAGFEVTVSPEVRKAIWYKLWGNLSTNPVSAITGATTDRILADPLVSQFCLALMAEAKAVGAGIGCDLPQTPEDRHAITRRLGAFKTSMLQDVEAGRGLELDAIVAAVRELGQRVGVPTPQIDTLFGLARLFGQVRGLYPR